MRARSQACAGSTVWRGFHHSISVIDGSGRGGSRKRTAAVRRGWLVGHIESPIAFVVYGIGGLVVPLVLLFLWLRLRMRTRSPAS